MKRKINLFVLFLLLIFFSACSKETPKKNSQEESISRPPTIKIVSEPSSKLEEPADVLQVFYFHNTSRCSTCLRVGKYVQETLEENFSDEISSGKIDYRVINVDLSENRALAQKFQAVGSSLYLNAIRGDADNIEKDIYAWRNLQNEEIFKAYLKTRINSFINT